MLTIVWNPRGFHLIKVFDKDRKFNTGYYIAEILEPLSHYPNGAQWKQQATSENCWCIRTPRTGIPPGYQLNILTRIK
jgi:endo-1,4-beta-D-glucanase Y